jgi:hypothetical protein
VVYVLPAEPAHRSVQAEPGDAERPAHLVPPWCAVDIRRWRAENPKAVAAYNAARRLGAFPKTCSICGREWLAARRPRFGARSVKRSTCVSGSGDRRSRVRHRRACGNG